MAEGKSNLDKPNFRVQVIGALGSSIIGNSDAPRTLERCDYKEVISSLPDPFPSEPLFPDKHTSGRTNCIPARTETIRQECPRMHSPLLEIQSA
jgi:hypothetical protein